MVFGIIVLNLFYSVQFASLTSDDFHSHSHGDDVMNGLEGNQLPPPDSIYRAIFGNCGLPNPHKRRRSGEDYIKGGKDVPDFKYPWMGKIGALIPSKNFFGQLFGQADWTVQCTAVLISARHAISAGHCFWQFQIHHYKNYGKIIPVSEGKISVVFGYVGEGETRVGVANIYVPKKKFGSDHDLVVLELDRDVLNNPDIRPICLPIDGIPMQKSVHFAGFGHAGIKTRKEVTKNNCRHPDCIEILDEVVENKRLQEDDTGLFLGPTPGFTNPSPWPPADSGIPLKMDIAEEFKNDDHAKYSHMDFPMRNLEQQFCGGDAAAPLMVKHPETQQFMLIGTAIASNVPCYSNIEPETEAIVTANKVSIHLEDIVSFLSSDRHILPDDQGSCLHKDCNPRNVLAYDTTYMLKVKEGTREKRTELAAPCQYIPELTKFVCPVGLTATRNATIDLKGKALEKDLKTSWRYCHACPKRTGGERGKAEAWSDINYLDELTTGSFSLPRYNGVESPYEDLNLHEISDKSNIIPYGEVCHIENKVGHVKCPKYAGQADQCILPESICDGIDDCLDSWDESPHLCIGKCDYWHQYQYPNLAYPETKQSLIRLNDISADSAKECQERCEKNVECDLFNWYGKGSSKNPNTRQPCIMLRNTDGLNGAAFSATNKADEVTRGPSQCPTNNFPENRVCTPVNGIAYRSGVYLIQANNGHFLTAKWDIDALIPFISPSLFIDVTKNHENPTDKKTSENDAEWLLDFYGQEDIAESYFTIRSGFAPPKTEIREPEFLFHGFGKIPRPYILPEKDATNVKWHMELVRAWRGMTEVRIFVKGSDGSKWYLSLQKLTREYHYTVPELVQRQGAEYNNTTPFLMTEVGKVYDFDRAKAVLIKEELFSDEGETQIFRIWECDYNLQTGQSARGIKRKLIKLEDGLTIKDVIEKQFLKWTQNKHTKNKDAALEKIFGISHARVQQAHLDNTMNDLISSIDKAIMASDSLFDYAGRMRILPHEFSLMLSWWKTYPASRVYTDKGKQFDDCTKEKDIICYFVKTYVQAGFIPIRNYVKQI